MNIDHLNALTVRLLHEQARLEQATTENQRIMRRHWIDQIKREIANEEASQGLGNLPDMTDAELLSALASD